MEQKSFGHSSLSARSGCTEEVIRGYFHSGRMPGDDLEVDRKEWEGKAWVKVCEVDEGQVPWGRGVMENHASGLEHAYA